MNHANHNNPENRGLFYVADGGRLSDMEYKGYVANITYDDELESFFGQVANTLDVITFYGKSVDELKREFALSVDAHLAFCAEQGIEPSQPQ